MPDKLSIEQEADLIVEKLSKTDAERAYERWEQFKRELAKVLAEEIAREIDDEILAKIKINHLNNTTTDKA